MKKRVISLLSVVAMVFSLFAMTGCGSNGGSNELVGTWTVDEVNDLEKSTNLKDSVSADGFDAAALSNATMAMAVKMLFQEGSEVEFSSDGNAVLGMGMEVGYKISDGKLKLSANGDTVSLKMTNNGDSVTLEIKDLIEVKLSK